jgi:hypothetical protein
MADRPAPPRNPGTDSVDASKERPNVAQDAETITEVLDTMERDGFEGQFRAVVDQQVECLTCHCVNPASTFAPERSARLEGASDPADMVMIVAVTCPRCDERGTLVLSYGPDSSVEEAGVLEALGDLPAPTTN